MILAPCPAMPKHRPSGVVYTVDSALKPLVLEYMRGVAAAAASGGADGSGHPTGPLRFDADDCVATLPPQYARKKQAELLKTVSAGTCSVAAKQSSS